MGIRRTELHWRETVRWVAPTLGVTSLGLAAWTVEGQVCCTPKVGAKAKKDNSPREGKVSVRCQVVRRGRLPGVAYSFPAASGHAHGHLRRAQPSSSLPARSRPGATAGISAHARRLPEKPRSCVASPRRPLRARRGKRGLGGEAHARTRRPGAHARRPRPPPPRSEEASASREAAAAPEANWEAELDVNRTSQTVSPAALRRRCGLGEGGDDDCDGLPGCPKWEWCGLPEGERKRSRSGQAAASASGLR